MRTEWVNRCRQINNAREAARSLGGMNTKCKEQGCLVLVGEVIEQEKFGVKAEYIYKGGRGVCAQIMWQLGLLNDIVSRRALTISEQERVDFLLEHAAELGLRRMGDGQE